MADSQDAKTFTAGDPEPDVHPGAIAVVNYGDYRTQEAWVRSGSNIGAWCPLGGEYWYKPPGVIKTHPVWEDVVARGPVTLLVPASSDAYERGWVTGRRDLVEQMERVVDDLPAVTHERPDEPAGLTPCCGKTEPRIASEGGVLVDDPEAVTCLGEED